MKNITMKKIILLIFASLVCIISHAQINNKIIGLTLGKSTQQEVNTILRKYNLPKYEENSTDVYNYIICYGKQFQLIGQTWDYAKFYFLDNKLYTISLSCIGDQRYTLSVFNHLKKILDDKYSNYFIDDSMEDGDRYIDYNDGITSIQLSLMKGGGYFNIGLRYYNNKLVQEEYNRKKNNL